KNGGVVPGHRPDENLKGLVAAKGEPRFAHLQDARRPRLHDAKSAAGPDAELRHASDPRRLAVNLRDIRLFAALEEFERDRVHGTESQQAERSRLHLNITGPASASSSHVQPPMSSSHE